MGEGRLPWTARAVAVLVALQLAASAAVLAARPTSSRTTALVRAAPAPPPAPTTVLDPTTVAPPPPPTAPPVTAARPPAPPAPPDAAGRLTARLNGALGAVRGCLAVYDGTTPLYLRAADSPMMPASTQKLLVAAAALDQLGPDFRFETTVVAPTPPKDGSVDALWLVGGGDPLLATPEYTAHLAAEPRTAGTPATPLAALVDALAAAGVRSVKGGVHGDDSRYERLRWLPGWKPIYRDEADVSPLSALTVDGGLDKWDPADAVTADPTALASTQLARLLTAHGVTAAPAPSSDRPAGGVVLARVASAPLSQIVAAMLRSSDNLAAELVVRELDRHAGGAGTTAGGLQVVGATAQRLGLPTAGLHMGDGSGLDPSDRASCSLLLGVMNLGDRAPFTAIADGLAVAGRPGTLAHRFVGTPLAGALAAKTGWINCGAGMIGKLSVHQPLRFALLVNGPCDWASAESYENRVVAALATYPA